MLTAKQIADIIRTEMLESDSATMAPRYETAAAKIAALIADDGSAVAAAMLENEVTSTLMDMTVATVLATLIEEEGGGRSNIAISPMSMDHMMKHYLYEVRNEGMIRHVSIKLREDSDLKDEAAWREPSNRHGVMHQDEDASGAKPQAEPKVRDRPIWAISYVGEDGERHLANMLDQADATRRLHQYHLVGAVEPEVQNRYCLHPDCPSTGCNHMEATSDAE